MIDALGEEVVDELLVYLDETGFMDKDTEPLYGYSKKGEPLYGEIYGSKRGRTNLIAAYCNGQILPEPLAITGSVDQPTFNYWFEEKLIPHLKRGQIVIMDNATIHKLDDDVLAFLRSKHCYFLPLPSYSPDLNRIENEWPLLKHYRRNIPKSLKLTNTFDQLTYIFKEYVAAQSLGC